MYITKVQVLEKLQIQHSTLFDIKQTGVWEKNIGNVFAQLSGNYFFC